MRRLKVRTPTRMPGTPPRPASSARRASVSVTHQACSWPTTGCPSLREMIMARSEEERRAALEQLLPHQQADFEGIFEAMARAPVTIRLLDPPLHEFLPPLDEAGGDERMRERIRSLQEVEPDARHAWVPARIMWPEIYGI